MKQKLCRYLPVLTLATLLFAGCKKENDATEKLTADAEIATHYDDEAMVSEELDGIASDANAVFEAEPVLSGDASVLDEVICDATVAANFESDPMTVTVTFNGSACGNKRTREGVVVFSMAKGTEWKTAGATINVTFQNLKITRKGDGKSITLNGTKVYTNVSGGLVHEAATSGPITHAIQSDDLSIKFGDGTARSWNVARKKVFSYDNGLVITVFGIKQEGNSNDIAEWGVNRFGHAFTTSITAPVVVKQDCNFRVTAGELKHKTDVFTATATFGLDSGGNPAGCPGAGKYYYRLAWLRASNGNSFNILLPY